MAFAFAFSDKNIAATAANAANAWLMICIFSSGILTPNNASNEEAPAYVLGSLSLEMIICSISDLVLGPKTNLKTDSCQGNPWTTLFTVP